MLHLDTQADRKQIILNSLVAAEPEYSAQVLLGWIVYVDVLQQFRSEAVVGMCAGQNLQDSAVVRAQEHHRPVLVGASRNIHHYLSQLGPGHEKEKVLSDL